MFVMLVHPKHLAEIRIPFDNVGTCSNPLQLCVGLGRTIVISFLVLPGYRTVNNHSVHYEARGLHYLGPQYA